MTTVLRSFKNDSSGGVTVDWVVLTAAVVGMGIAAAVNIAEGTIQLGDNLKKFLHTEEPFIQNE
tara:strand:+ start:211 stop:402 length:192 start_codon:yes stop_codon:yes gene_type:complete